MKSLEVKHSELELGGVVGDVTQFSVKIDGHIFKLMTDGLYSAKVPSVVREILANAIDAQIQSGRDETVLVSLPTAFNNNFRVRDFGDGMSHEFVQVLYTQLGHSTKRDDNTQTGFFGMGSKSPFTISDQFQITVFEGTHKRVYTAALAPSGIPELHFGGRYPSPEPSGVEVSIPVSSNLVGQFESAVRASAFAYFDKNIKFNRDFGDGAAPLDWAQKNFKKVAEGVYTSRERTRGSYHSRGGYGNISIRQGFAVYPLEVNQLRLDQATGNILRKLSAKDNQVYLDAALGTFNVTASREKIQYDTPSVENLNNHIRALMLEAVKNITAQVAGIKTHRDCVSRLEQVYLVEYSRDEQGNEQTPEIGEVVQSAKDMHDLYKDVVEDNWADYIKSLKLKPDDARPRMMSKFTVDEKVISPSAKFYTSSASFYWTNTMTGADNKKEIVGGASFTKSERVTWDIGDLTYVLPSVCRYWQERVYKHATGVIQARFGQYDGTYRATIQVIRCNRLDVQDCIAKLKEHDVQILGDIFTEDKLPLYTPDAATASVVRQGYSKTAVYKLKATSSSYGWGWDKNKIEAPSDEPAYYVSRVGIGSSVHLLSDNDAATVINAVKVYGNGLPQGFVPHRKIDNAALFRAIEAAYALGFVDKEVPIYRVTESQRDRLNAKPDSHEWIDLGPLLAQGFMAAFDKYTVPAISNSYDTIQTVASPRVVKTLMDEFHDLISACGEMEKGVSFSDASRSFLRNANVFGNRGMFDIIDSLSNDGLAMLLLPAYMTDSRSSYAQESAKNHVEITATGTGTSALFASVPNPPKPTVMNDVNRLYTSLNDDFALLHELNYLSPNRGEHVARYLTATLDVATVQSVKVTDYPGLVPIVQRMRDEMTKAKASFIDHQKKAAIKV